MGEPELGTEWEVWVKGINEAYDKKMRLCHDHIRRVEDEADKIRVAHLVTVDLANAMLRKYEDLEFNFSKERLSDELERLNYFLGGTHEVRYFRAAEKVGGKYQDIFRGDIDMKQHHAIIGELLNTCDRVGHDSYDAYTRIFENIAEGEDKLEKAENAQTMLGVGKENILYGIRVGEVMLNHMPGPAVYAKVGNLQMILSKIQRVSHNSPLRNQTFNYALQRSTRLFEKGCLVSNFKNAECCSNFAKALANERETATFRTNSIDSTLESILHPKIMVALGELQIVNEGQGKSDGSIFALATIIQLAVMHHNEDDVYSSWRMGCLAAEELQFLLSAETSDKLSLTLNPLFEDLHNHCVKVTEAMCGTFGNIGWNHLNWWVNFFHQSTVLERVEAEVSIKKGEELNSYLITDLDMKDGRTNKGKLKLYVLNMMDGRGDKGLLQPETFTLDFTSKQLKILNLADHCQRVERIQKSGVANAESLNDELSVIIDMKDIASFPAGAGGRTLQIQFKGARHPVAVLCKDEKTQALLNTILAPSVDSVTKAAQHIDKGGESEAIKKIKQIVPPAVIIEMATTGYGKDGKPVREYTARCAGLSDPVILGRGGVGNVFLATDSNTGKNIATKILNPTAIKSLMANKKSIQSQAKDLHVDKESEEAWIQREWDKAGRVC